MDRSKPARPATTPWDWVPLVALLIAAWLCRNLVPPWVYMWLLAGAMFAGCKWATGGQLARQNPPPPRRLVLAYLTGWVGMNFREFALSSAPARPARREWLLAWLKITFGACLLWGLVPAGLRGGELLAGWTGMIGLVFILHFGTFHLLALAWQRAGVDARPIMQAPLRATSVTEFWGRRWNAAFHELVHARVFRPLCRRVGVAAATLAGFLASGLIHEVVISVPARGGYGLPAAYFVLQGIAVLFERGGWGRRLGLGRGVRGWLFTMLCVGGPAFWLFHPWFMHRVMLPMLAALGAW